MFEKAGNIWGEGFSLHLKQTKEAVKVFK